jgi:type I restriction enzyme M protein
MITGELKSKIDKVWDAFWSGGISNPLSVIEQISYLLFIKRLDELHTAKELLANRTNQPIVDPIFSKEQNDYRWSVFKDYSAEEMFRLVTQKVFPFIKNIHSDKQDSSYDKHMKDAIFMIPTPGLLQKVVDMISDIPMEDRDTKGDLYEYLLSKIASAGVNGQFRTPRHIIKMMVEIMKPVPSDTICDPACGTAGFLVASGEYLREHHREMLHNTEQKKHFNSKMFNGFDFDSTMLRIGSMNMMLHGIENPNIIPQDSLSEDTADFQNAYTLILANPPFKGSIDETTTAKNLLQVVKTKKTELLFIALILRLLKNGGRCAVIVPDGVLFGSSNAHLAIRKELIEHQKLEAIISMPSGVFKPYAGVSTGIMIFTKTNSGGTDNVWFYDMQADGYSLDDKRTKLDQDKHENNNIPDIIDRYQNLSAEKDRKRTQQSFCVPKEEIVANKYDLSINRYKEIIYEEVKYDPPKQIIESIKILENDILKEMKELEEMLG